MNNDGLKFHSGTWHGYVADQGWAEIFADLDKWLVENPGEMVVHFDCRDVRRIETPKGVVYLKDIRHLTNAGMHKKELFSWAKWIFRGSRAIQHWNACHALVGSGFACPKPLLAVRQRNGITPHDIFISAAIDLPNLWEKVPDGMTPESMAEFLGETLQVFHAAGFFHGDYILRNLCYDPKDKCIIYFDNDRTSLPPWPIKAHQQRRNLAQMTYSLLQRYDEKICEHFLNAYSQANDWPGEHGRKNLLQEAIKRDFREGKNKKQRKK